MTAPAPHVSQVDIAADHPAFDGHFPGRPLLPGVVLLALATEAALAAPAWAARLGSTPRIASAKFLAPVRPGDALTLTLSAPRPDRVAFEWRCGERRVGSGVFEADHTADAVAGTPAVATPTAPPR